MNNLTATFLSFVSNITTWSPEIRTDLSSFLDTQGLLSKSQEVVSIVYDHSALWLNQIYQGHLSEAFEVFLSSLYSLISWLDFTDFQLTLLREFTLILVGNSILVFIAWKIYGPRISAKFGVCRSSRRVIDELRLSMSELQLPKEHDFKFK